jgi:NhaP-type Na+/H+ or K+/H+ antiporter
VFSNAWRAVTYFNDGLGWHVELLPFSVTRIQPRPVAFVNAALMAIIVLMLARSAWVGFTTWRERRLMPG